MGSMSNSIQFGPLLVSPTADNTSVAQKVTFASSISQFILGEKQSALYSCFLKPSDQRLSVQAGKLMLKCSTPAIKIKL